jgi:hypothetical protein
VVTALHRWTKGPLDGDRRVPPILAALAVAIPALGLYALTLLRDVDFWDTAEFQAVGPVLGIAHPTGYPTYTLLLWLASVVFQPFGNEALRANMLSAVLVAMSSGVLAALVASLTGRVMAGIAAGAALAVTPQAWAVAVRADPHALHLLFVCLLLALLIGWQHRLAAGSPTADRWLLAAAALFGLALGNHALTVLLVPGIGLFVLAVAPRVLLDRPRFSASCIGLALLAAAAVYAYLPLRSAMNPPLDYGNPETLSGFVYVVLAKQFQGSFHELPSLGAIADQISGQMLASLGLLALLIPFGVYETVVRRGALLLLLAGWTVPTWLFSLTYTNADIERYYLTPIVAGAVVAGIGAGVVWRLIEPYSDRARAARVVVAGIMTVLLLAPPLVAIPLRYDRLDSSDGTAGREYLEAALTAFEQDAVVISWWSMSTTLWYGQFVEGRRPDVWVVDDSTMADQDLGSPTEVIDRHLGSRPVYLIRIPPDLPEFEERYVLTPVVVEPALGSPIFRVDGRREGGG